MKIIIKKINEIYLKIYTEKAIELELSDFFSFDVKNAHFVKRKTGKKSWDGKIRLFNRNNKQLFVGLLYRIYEFAKDRNYEIEYYSDDKEEYNLLSEKEAIEFINTLNMPSHFEIREHQLKPFVQGISFKRNLFLSPTNSGKSLIIYWLHRFFTQNETGRTLIIVPTINLVDQMTKDFCDYGYDEHYIYKIRSGVDKDNIPSDCECIISTWQSLVNLDYEWFTQFNTVVGDEVHTFKAKSLQEIMGKTYFVKNKFGLTGTLDGSETNKLILEGLFGPVKQYITTKELQNLGYSSQLKIIIILFKYSKEVKKTLSGKYAEEIDFICSYEPRNKYIRNLVLSLKNNSLVLFNRVENHGVPLFNLISERRDNTRIIHGKVPAEEREEIRQLFSESNDLITLASKQTFAEGANMPNLHNIIYASPHAGRIKNLQSIGRGLRVIDGKKQCLLVDFADNLSKKTAPNHTLKHLMERMKQYAEEGFKFKIIEVELD